MAECQSREVPPIYPADAKNSREGWFGSRSWQFQDFNGASRKQFHCTGNFMC